MKKLAISASIMTLLLTGCNNDKPEETNPKTTADYEAYEKEIANYKLDKDLERDWRNMIQKGIDINKLNDPIYLHVIEIKKDQFIKATSGGGSTTYDIKDTANIKPGDDILVTLNKEKTKITKIIPIKQETVYRKQINDQRNQLQKEISQDYKSFKEKYGNLTEMPRKQAEKLNRIEQEMTQTSENKE